MPLRGVHKYPPPPFRKNIQTQSAALRVTNVFRRRRRRWMAKKGVRPSQAGRRSPPIRNIPDVYKIQEATRQAERI